MTVSAYNQDGPRPLQHTFIARYNRRLLRRRMAKDLVSFVVLFSPAAVRLSQLAKVMQISCLGPKFLPPSYR